MAELNPFKKSETGDRVYHGTTMIFGKPVEVQGKKHYQQLLKENGMPDASLKECQQQAEYRKRRVVEENKEKREKQGREFMNILKENQIPNETVKHWVKENFVSRPAGGGKKWV